jgi:phage host-nuclease inhibitor protein Gam
MTSFSSPSPAPTIRTREQLDAVVENIVSLKGELAELERAQATEIVGVREKFRAPLTEVDRFLQKEIAWVETWARQNPSAFVTDRLLRCPHATIGYRMMPPRVERASRQWTWTEAASRLSEVEWGRRYLRTPAAEVDRDAILADLASLSNDELRQVGIKIVQGERFFIEPHGHEEEALMPEATWQEAA